LRDRARACGMPVIYVNDNFDSWHLGFRELIQTFRDAGVPGSVLIDMLEAHALHQMHRLLKADLTPSAHLPLEELARRSAAGEVPAPHAADHASRVGSRSDAVSHPATGRLLVVRWSVR
jgi:hypothetical protein